MTIPTEKIAEFTDRTLAFLTKASKKAFEKDALVTILLQSLPRLKHYATQKLKNKELNKLRNRNKLKKSKKILPSASLRRDAAWRPSGAPNKGQITIKTTPIQP